MARTAVTVTALSTNAGVSVAGVGTAIDATNGHVIATDGRTHRLIIHVKNTTGSSKAVTVKASSSLVPAFRSSLGDLVVTIAATTGEQMLVLESARFAQPDGSINIDIAASMTGTIAVYKAPVA